MEGGKRFADRYTAEDVEQFDRYIAAQLERVNVENITDEERAYMRTMMLTMYANPLKNKLLATEK